MDLGIPTFRQLIFILSNLMLLMPNLMPFRCSGCCELQIHSFRSKNRSKNIQKLPHNLEQVVLSSSSKSFWSHPFPLFCVDHLGLWPRPQVADASAEAEATWRGIRLRPTQFLEFLTQEPLVHSTSRQRQARYDFDLYPNAPNTL